MPSNLPLWASQLRDRWAANISSVFLLTGNTRDYVSGEYPMLVGDFLELLLKQDFSVVGFYNRATGLSIADRDQENEFLRRTGQSGGAAPGSSGSKLPQEPMRFFPAADRALRSAVVAESGDSPQKPLALVIEYADTLFPNSPALTPEERSALIYCQRWAIDQELINTGPLVVLVAQALSDVNPALRAASSRVEHLEVPMPDFDTRLSFIRSLSEKAEPRLRLADMSIEELAAKTAGLNLLGIEDVKLRAADQPVTAELVRERKDEIIKSEVGDVLASDDPTWGLDAVGGLDEVKSWLWRSVIRPLQTNKLRRVPQGILLAGPPGTGKTYLAKALAHDAGVNYREVDFGRLLGGIVGTSEKNLENVLRVLEASSPCIVFIDEIDQALRRGTDGLNSVQDNIFGRMLRWLSEPSHRGRIVVLAATNRPDLLDAALKRAGRFDAKIPILPPDLDGRKDGLVKLLRRYSPGSTGCEPAIADIASSTDGWTMAELELVVVKAVELADDDEREDVTPTDLADARGLVSPSTTETQYMTDLAIMECTDKSLLPAGYRTKLDNRSALEDSVREQEPRFRRARRAFSEEAA